MADPAGRLSMPEAGLLQLGGRFDHSSILPIREEGEKRIRSLSSQSCRVDLSEVESGDSVFLSLLLSWSRLCKAHGVKMELTGVPSSLLDMARVSGLETVLPIVGNEDSVSNEASQQRA